MLGCHACVRRLIAAVAPDATILPSSAVRNPLTRASHTSGSIDGRRHYAALAGNDTRSHSGDVALIQPELQISRQRHAVNGKHAPVRSSRGGQYVFSDKEPNINGPVRKYKSYQDPNEIVDGKDASSKDANKLDAAKLKRMEHTLSFLIDPLRLSEYVQRQLNKDRLDEALSITRLASSRQMKTTVAWNFIIDWQLERGKTSAAVKTFNEMKKRAQQPDAYTYSVLLRGLARYHDRPNIVQKALSVYNSMLGPNSKVPPRTVHANLMLKMCADAGDMDSMWVIAGSLTDEGTASADERTYTIILKAEFQHAVENAPEDASPENLAAHYEASVLQGRKLWVGIVRRWRSGRLKMDEGLVRCMGKLLMLSYRPRDWDDVFSLVQQTQNVPRMVGLLGTERHARAKQLDAIGELDLTDVPEEMKRDVNDHMMSVRGNEFTSKPFDSAPPHQTGARSFITQFATPGRSTLSLLMEACLKLCSKKAADDYWHFLTGEKYGIQPDHDNYKSYLRVLRQAHNSGKAVQILKDGYQGQVMGHDLFRLSMAACTRDKLNPKAFSHATEIMHMMRTQAKLLDPVAMFGYMKLARDSEDPERIEMAVRIMDTLAKRPGGDRFSTITSGAVDGKTDLQKKTLSMFWGLCNTVIQSIDWLTARRQMDAAEKAAWRARREDYKLWTKAFGAVAGKYAPSAAENKRMRGGTHLLNTRNVNRTNRTLAAQANEGRKPEVPAL